MTQSNRVLLKKYGGLMMLGMIIMPLAFYLSVVILPYLFIFMDLVDVRVMNIMSILLFVIISSAFLIISFIFFNKIRKRLLQLQHTMDFEKDDGELRYAKISDDDEVGNLEQSFNHMVQKLEESRAAEQQEEQLRRDLIANLSHDLRTPLTSMRGQLSQIKRQSDIADDAGFNSLDQNIDYMDRLIDSLLSYTLLSADRYPYEEEKVELNAFMRKYIAEWYSVFEEENFEVDAEITEAPVTIQTDKHMLLRLLNNLVQNVLRHAGEGKYIGFTVSGSEIIIEDRGAGFENAHEATKGSGIGLSIVELLAEKLKMNVEFDSDGSGTRVHLKMNRD